MADTMEWSLAGCLNTRKKTLEHCQRRLYAGQCEQCIGFEKQHTVSNNTPIELCCWPLCFMLNIWLVKSSPILPLILAFCQGLLDLESFVNSRSPALQSQWRPWQKATGTVFFFLALELKTVKKLLLNTRANPYTDTNYLFRLNYIYYHRAFNFISPLLEVSLPSG